jgi:hypothetical protein
MRRSLPCRLAQPTAGNSTNCARLAENRKRAYGHPTRSWPVFQDTVHKLTWKYGNENGKWLAHAFQLISCKTCDAQLIDFAMKRRISNLLFQRSLCFIHQRRESRKTLKISYGVGSMSSERWTRQKRQINLAFTVKQDRNKTVHVKNVMPVICGREFE